MLKKLIFFMIIFILSINLVAAVTINHVNADNLAPGSEGVIRIEVENNLNEDVEDVSLNLKFENLPFSPVGSSEMSENEIDEDDEETFSFRIRSSNEIKPGDYEIPYILQYKLTESDILKTRTGSIGVRVTGNPELVYSVSIKNPVENQKGFINLKVVNKGFSDARFVSVKVFSKDFVLLSEEEVYMGTVDSDDFETAEFEVLFDKNPANFKAVIEYKDFDNFKKTENINLPLTIYSVEDALRLGITKKSSGPVMLIAVVALLIFVMVTRIIRKRRKLKKSMRANMNRPGKMNVRNKFSNVNNYIGKDASGGIGKDAGGVGKDINGVRKGN